MVGLIDDYFKKYPINSRIKLHEDYGTVKYVGEVTGHAGLWVGIEWDDPTRGKHDGIVNGTRYFQTKHPTSGSMIRPGKLGPFESLEEATKNRYLLSERNPLDENLMRETQRYLQASVFEIVGMEKIAKKQSRVEVLTDISVVHSAVNTAGDLSAFKSLTSLNISETLIWNWRTIAEIVSQVPTLTDISVSCNRLQVPNEEEIIQLEPNFRHLKHINLRKCGFEIWSDIMQTAKLWPNIESIGLQENNISKITPVDCNKIFKNLRELDLHMTKLSDFNEICKLGNIKTLNSLLLMENNIKEIKLPDCDFDKKLTIFPSLEKLNVCHNPLEDSSYVFNELDKLPALKNLSKTADPKTGFEEMFSKAVALISDLMVVNKVEITREQRRGAEYDIWKKYGLEWLQSESNSDAKEVFCKKYRSYPKLVKKYGSPAEFSIRPATKVANLININIRNKITGEVWQKKVPRKISLQTLQGLIIKHFKMEQTMPKLSYIDANHTNLIVEMENMSKSLDFYSVQDGDTVVIEW